MVATNYMSGQEVPATQLNGDFSKAINRAGDTMSGILRLAQDPVSPLDAATKQYIDNKASGIFTPTVADGIAAAGSDQGSATPLGAYINILTSGPTNSGVSLNTSLLTMKVMNRGTSAYFVYPPSGHTIETNLLNAPVRLAVNNGAEYSRGSGSTVWRVS